MKQISKMIVQLLLSLSLMALLDACATIPSVSQRRVIADQLAATKQWAPELLRAGSFDLLSYVPLSQLRNGTLTIYLEGDGLAWITPDQPSDDPTPRQPVALRMALAQPAGDAAYLARVCQYVEAAITGCLPRYWTAHRFAPEVIEATDLAIAKLKQQFGATRLILVGYSGGGAVAALVAARRSDVVILITVAGNLDHAAWTTYHRVSPLVGSMNAADMIERLVVIPQIHFVGETDAVVPPILTASFINRFPADQQPRIIQRASYDHACCWVDSWAELFGLAISQLKAQNMRYPVEKNSPP